MEHDDSPVSDTSKQSNSWFLLDDSDVEVCEEATPHAQEIDDNTIHASFVIKTDQDRRLIEEIVHNDELPWDTSDIREADAITNAPTSIEKDMDTATGVVPEKCTSCAAVKKTAAARRQTEHTVSMYNTFLAICVIGVGSGMALYFQSDPDLSFMSTYSVKDVYRPSVSYNIEHKYDKDRSYYGSGKQLDGKSRKYDGYNAATLKVRYIPRKYQVTYEEHKDKDYSKDYKKLKQRSRRNEDSNDQISQRKAKGNKYKYDNDKYERKTANKEYYRKNEKNRYKSVTGKSSRKEY